MNLFFENTCEACPEQYDVLDLDQEGHPVVGYVRLRWGLLRCSVPDPRGECIYRKEYDHGFLGSFPSEEERDRELKAIEQAIENYYSNV